MDDSLKRSAEADLPSHRDKRQKPQKARKWRFEGKNRSQTSAATIEPGSMGILATCPRGKERKAEDELLALFEHVRARRSRYRYGLTDGQYIQELYPAGALADSSNEEDSDRDIEADIDRELRQMKVPDNRSLLRAIKIDIECGASG